METDKKIADKNCIFCKIVSGEIQAHKVYEDNDTLAFLDIDPTREGHTLVIPKEHHEYIENMPDELYSQIMLVVKKLKTAYKKIFNVPQVGFFVSGWDVPHAHVHVVPMEVSTDISSKGTSTHPSPTPSYGGFAKTVTKITQAL